MADNFGLKIGLEGEKEFKKALSDINSQFKVLGSEMKLVESQFGKNNTSVESLTARNQVLGKEIESQKSKIETLKSALENAASSFGENDRRTQAWQVQLNNAQAALNDMEREVSDNEKAIEELGGAESDAEGKTKGLSDSVDDAGEEASDAKNKFDKFKSVAADVGKAAAAAVAAIGAACVAAGKAIWDMANETASAGDNIDKMSQKLGISAEAYQEWDYICQRCGTDVTKMQTSMKTLSTVITDAGAGSSSAAEKLAAVGLSIEDLNGKSQEQRLSMVVSALQDMGPGAERTAAAVDLLGKAGTDMAAVLNMSAEETEALRQEVHDYGMILSDEGVAASAAFEDSLTKLQSTFSGLKNTMTAELLPAMTQIMDGLSDLMAGNDEAGEEIKAGVTELIDGIMELIPQIVTLIATLAQAVLESAPSIISALAEGIIGALPQMSETIMTVITSLITAIVELLPQLVQAGMDILTSLIQGIAQALPTIIPAVVEVILTVVQTIIDNLPSLLDAVLQVIEGLAQGILNAIPVIIEALPEVITSIIEFLLDSIPQIIQTGIDLLTSLVEALPEIITAIVEAIPQIIDGIINAVLEAIPLIIQAGIDLLISLIQALPQIITTIVEAIPQIISGIVNAVIGNIDKIILAGVQLFVALVENLPTIIVEIVKAIPQIISALVSGFGSFFSTMGEIGLNLIKGLWNGISNAAEWLWQKISGFFGGVVSRIKNFFGIASPSKLFAEMGGFMAEGLGVGFGDEMDTVGDEMTEATAEAGDLTGRTALEAIKEGLQNNLDLLDKPIAELVYRIAEKLADVLPQIMEEAMAMGEQFVELLQEKGNEVLEFFEHFIFSIRSLFEKADGVFINIGARMMEGIGYGIRSRSAWLNSLMASCINSMKMMVEAQLGIHSPSKVFAEIGGNMAAGMGVGFEKEMSDVKRQMERSIPTAFDAPADNTAADMVNGIVGGLRSAMGGGSRTPIVLQVALDSRILAQTMFDPLKTVAVQRGVSYG